MYMCVTKYIKDTQICSIYKEFGFLFCFNFNICS